MTTKPYRQGIPAEILALSHERDILRRRGHYDRADALKRQIEEAGYAIKDNPHGAHLIILPSIEVDGTVYRVASQMPSLLNEADSCEFSVNVLAQNSFEQTQRCVESVLRFAGDHDIEIILVDNASQDELSIWAETLRVRDQRVHYVRPSRVMGEAEARNVGLKRSRGTYILLLDSSVELTGDVFSPLAETLADSSVGVTGLHGLHTGDLRHFEESEQGDVEAIDRFCMAFRRKLLKKVGLFDERYRFPLYMDVDFSFAVMESGTHNVVTANLPLICHPASQNERLSDAERSRLTKRNFYRFLDKWGDREDLLAEQEEGQEPA
ncbi:MAG TPA: glycosyltransferase [Ktedonobacteraceae bacterium]|nr:glycosyltransferase [Ktedonobacteraceae bacterium]